MQIKEGTTESLSQYDILIKQQIEEVPSFVLAPNNIRTFTIQYTAGLDGGSGGSLIKELFPEE